MAQIIDGKRVSLQIKLEIKGAIEQFKKRYNMIPGLAVILVGDDIASATYVRNKQKACEDVGINSRTFSFSSDIDEKELVALIKELNRSPEYHGILVQLPLPKHIDSKKVLNLIDGQKDVDGFLPVNIGKLFTGEETLYPCTPNGIMTLLNVYNIPVSGKHAVIVGRSNIVGKPLAIMMLSANATVTICHTKTKDIEGLVNQADILVAAAGRRGLIKGEWIKQGAVVIDVGMNRSDDGKLVGDVEFEEAQKRASYITPVPGGVGPMTIAMLMKNTLLAAERQLKS
ncbi:MAG: bifunctional methylenetetrahydrofolate dehydrogenase/methenyltetrahydrofolate cyclohydrolase FolD [Deltaproteobacteria bacterium]|nr:bifunctional methylenetetrahydrofolate dehydrogenase/methenyltetrahydrofolate cyclohydrolase FolD [Deltaproteobacteria bacterium]MCL5792319.1 bifunctional methylenetetrahydrofolate dehydrogenase/methenyltetrahydrofolate cyclohydrolase FolD [Deltaproteobacteria bacterium]